MDLWIMTPAVRTLLKVLHVGRTVCCVARHLDITCKARTSLASFWITIYSVCMTIAAAQAPMVDVGLTICRIRSCVFYATLYFQDEAPWTQRTGKITKNRQDYPSWMCVFVKMIEITGDKERLVCRSWPWPLLVATVWGLSTHRWAWMKKSRTALEVVCRAH